METNHKTKDLHISQWSAVVNAKCPRCRIGNAFQGPTYGFKSNKMNEFCPHCNLKFEREPGYFYVAMFVSYAFNVAQIISVCVAAYVFGLKLDYDNLWYFILILSLTTLLFSPFNYRYSRIALLFWLSPGLNYEPNRNK